MYYFPRFLSLLIVNYVIFDYHCRFPCTYNTVVLLLSNDVRDFNVLTLKFQHWRRKGPRWGHARLASPLPIVPLKIRSWGWRRGGACGGPQLWSDRLLSNPISTSHRQTPTVNTLIQTIADSCPSRIHKYFTILRSANKRTRLTL